MTHPDAALIAPLLAVLTSRQRRARGELDSAEQALSPVSSTADLPAWVRVRVTVEQVRICYARRQPNPGQDWLDELGEDPHAAMLRATAAAVGLAGSPTVTMVDPGEDFLDVAVELNIARACLHVDDGDIPAAGAALARALRLGGSERLRRPFLEAPPQLRPLLRQPRLAAGAAWLNPSAPPVPPPRRPSGVAIPSVRLAAATPLVPPQLSVREREVLQCLADMLSTVEIAAALFVSVNTVRTHIRSILRKLAVGRRNEAIRRAWELGLVENGRSPSRLPQSVGGRS